VYWCDIYYNQVKDCSGKGKARGAGVLVRSHSSNSKGVTLIESYEARPGTVVRVREGHWKSDSAGMLGTMQKCWGTSEHAAVDVLMEDGRLELFWLPNLDAVEEDIAV
jgi:hypothetical protein